MKNGHLQSIKNLVDFCTFHGLEDVVISPGSRSAPISILFSRVEKVNIHVVVDERSAAYFALGIAIKKSKPVALVCTSGTAAYNYAPAVAEAFYMRAPLLVLTADRPLQWLNHSEGQQIDQSNLYGNHVNKFLTYDSDSLANNINEQFSLIKEAFQALQDNSAPVHINIPIPEPLYDLDKLQPCECNTSTLEPRQFSDKTDKIADISSLISSCSKVMILLGQQHNETSFSEEVLQTNQLEQVVVLSDLLSNNFKNNTLHTIDNLLFGISREDLPHYQPEVLITIGTNHVSKRLKDVLRTTLGLKHIHLDENGWFPDTFNQLSEKIVCQPLTFLKACLSRSENNVSQYGTRWKQLSHHTITGTRRFLKNASWNDLHIANTIQDHLPKQSVLHMGNSMSVRYFETLIPRADLSYFANRGTSGIDGSLSTAVGYSSYSDKINTVVIGDTSFMYDSNALWKETLPTGLKILVLNNGGGGIFKFIKGPSGLPETDRLFAASHNYSMQHLAAHHKVKYASASNMQELQTALTHLFNNGETTVLEIFTDPEENAKTLKNFFNSLKHKSWQVENGKQ